VISLSETKHTLKIEARIRPLSREKSILYDQDLKSYVICVKSPPEKGKANKEVLKLLREYFKAERVDLVSGYESRTKSFIVTNPKVQM